MIMKLDSQTENLAYHASRLLLLILYCGKPQTPKSTALPAVEGRTLLAKLDFFIRYPAYLIQAAKIEKQLFTNKEIGVESLDAPLSVESRMVRYLYGPWDHIYYPSLAYLVGKQLIIIETKNGTDVFRITAKGKEIAGLLARDASYEDIANRAKYVYKLFNKYTGSRLKLFIYHNFPEVVNRNLGEKI